MKPLHFVIQHHIATRPHYDFRLEHRGVLLSWAVPKQPTPDPSVKRLAIQVDDHPLSYRTFEGEIPKGQYGAGTVTIWDKGYWTPIKHTDKEIKFELHGERLTGMWVLFKMQKEKEWLLIFQGAGSLPADDRRRL